MSWENNSGVGIKIAIIDSGININRSEFKNATIIKYNNKSIDTIGHGTAVASIIHKLVPEAELFDVQLFSIENEISTQDLVSLLIDIYEHQYFDIIHLSSGVVSGDISALYNICKRINEAGSFIVSAFDNEGKISYPAAFDFVIGVDWSERCSIGKQYIYVENSPVNILSIGSLQKLPWKDEEYKYVAGSSFAAPYITSMIAKIICTGIKDYKAVLQELKRASWKKIIYMEEQKSKSNDFSIRKAIIYPFNKEIHSLFRFCRTLSFDIAGIYEPILCRKVGAKVSKLLDMQDNNQIIQSERNINWGDDFDTVILGHVGIIASSLNRDIINEFLEKCILYKKNIYAFDNLSNYSDKVNILRNMGLFAYYPNVSKNDVPYNLMGKLYGISTPVVAVFGTSPKQGKFSLQIALRDQFRKLGYSVGNIGSEPSSLLFGFDDVYPMGYESSIDISGSDAIVKLNQMMHDIDIKGKDIIFVGSQSQTVPYNYGNIGLYPIAQHEFFVGTDPDAVVLCINPYDDIEYIQRTINYLSNYMESKVIALSLFPLHRDLEWAVVGKNATPLTREEIYNKKTYFEDNLHLPCFILGDEEELLKLVNVIIDFF